MLIAYKVLTQIAIGERITTSPRRSPNWVLGFLFGVLGFLGSQPIPEVGSWVPVLGSWVPVLDSWVLGVLV